MSTNMFQRMSNTPELNKTNISMFAANGSSLHVLGTTECTIELNSRVFKHTVVVVEGFNYEFLLGKDFLTENQAVVDFGNLCLKIQELTVKFAKPTSRKTVRLVDSLHMKPRSTCAIQTKCEAPIKTGDLLIEGGFLNDNSLFVARILTKVRPSNGKITVQISNITEQAVFLAKGSPIADVELFHETVTRNTVGNMINSVEAEIGLVLTEQDIDIKHLTPAEKDQLLNLLNQMNIVAPAKMGSVDTVEHSINVGDARPIKQCPTEYQ
eukprot:gene2892-3343_t